MFFISCIVFANLPTLIFTWSGILLNDNNYGTELYFPTTSPHAVNNLNFGLKPAHGTAAVLLNGRAYFTGGYYSTTAVADVTIFDPNKTHVNKISVDINRTWLSCSRLDRRRGLIYRI
jgi:hypothetical protein